MYFHCSKLYHCLSREIFDFGVSLSHQLQQKEKLKMKLFFLQIIILMASLILAQVNDQPFVPFYHSMKYPKLTFCFSETIPSPSQRLPLHRYFNQSHKRPLQSLVPQRRLSCQILQKPRCSTSSRPLQRPQATRQRRVRQRRVVILPRGRREALLVTVMCR